VEVYDIWIDDVQKSSESSVYVNTTSQGVGKVGVYSERGSKVVDPNARIVNGNWRHLIPLPLFDLKGINAMENVHCVPFLCQTFRQISEIHLYTCTIIPSKAIRRIEVGYDQELQVLFT
jgi:hypothetical protein